MSSTSDSSSIEDRFKTLLEEEFEKAKISGIDCGIITREESKTEDRVEEDRIRVDSSTIGKFVREKIALLRIKESGKLTLYHESKCLALQNGEAVMVPVVSCNPPPDAVLAEKMGRMSFFSRKPCRLVNGDECITLCLDTNPPAVKSIPLETITKQGSNNIISLINIFHTDQVPSGQPGNYALYFKTVKSGSYTYYFLVPEGENIIASAVSMGTDQKDEESVCRKHLKFTNQYINPGNNSVV